MHKVAERFVGICARRTKRTASRSMESNPRRRDSVAPSRFASLLPKGTEFREICARSVRIYCAFGRLALPHGHLYRRHNLVAAPTPRSAWIRLASCANGRGRTPHAHAPRKPKRQAVQVGNPCPLQPARYPPWQHAPPFGPAPDTPCEGTGNRTCHQIVSAIQAGTFGGHVRRPTISEQAVAGTQPAVRRVTTCHRSGHGRNAHPTSRQRNYLPSGGRPSTAQALSGTLRNIQSRPNRPPWRHLPL